MTDKEMGRIGVIVQARMGSTRLPGKVLMELGGKSLLEHVLERCSAVDVVDEVLVATTDLDEDDEIEQLCEQLGYEAYRGSSEDVLDRYVRAAKEFSIDTVVRVTADCPLLDPLVIQQAVTRFAEGDCDLVHTGESYPEGMGVEVISLEVLERAWRDASLPSDREHVTAYVWRSPDLFTVCPIECAEDASGLRLTVDHPEDMEVVTCLVDLLADRPLFGLEEVLEVSRRHPETFTANQGIPRREGYQISLSREQPDESGPDEA